MSKKEVNPGTFLYPVPAVMVSCADRKGNANIIAIAWVGVMSSDPPMVGIGVRSNRHSHPLITDSGEFVVNIPSAEQASALDYTGVVSGRDCDKFADTGLTAAKASVLEYAPMIEECPISLECKVTDRLPLGSHDYFVGEVVRVHVDEAWTSESGTFSVVPEQLMAYAQGRYYRLGEEIGRGGFSVKKD